MGTSGRAEKRGHMVTEERIHDKNWSIHGNGVGIGEISQSLIQ